MAFAKSDRNISTGVFLMVFLGLFLATFIFYIVASNQKLFDQKYKLSMYLPNAQGLNPGAFIALSGLKVGVVGGMRIINEPGKKGVTIDLKIDRDYANNITASSVAMVKTLGILGDKYVDITIGKEGEPPLLDGQAIQSDPGVDPYEMLDQATEMFADLKDVLHNTDSLTIMALRGEGMLGKFIADPQTAGDFAAMISRMNRISGQLAGGEGALGMLLKDRTLYTRLERSTANFEAIMDSINTGRGTFAQLLNNPDLYPQIESMAVRTDSLLFLLQHGGTIAKLLKDPQLYENLQRLTVSIDSLSTDLKANPDRYVQIKVF